MGVVLAILAIGSVAVILLAVLWSRVGAWGSAPVLVASGIRHDELRSRRESRIPRPAPAGDGSAVVTLLRPRRDDRLSG